jgi:hypothetical protein
VKTLRALLLLVCAALAGCASEGGVTGTGISASVSGNVTLVTEGLPSALPFPIRITVDQAPALTAVTDADGAFVLRGGFSGAVTLQFSNAVDGTSIGPLALEIPAGSVTVLENITIDTAAPPAARVQPTAVRQFDVVGRIDLVECGRDAATLLVTDNARVPRQFLIDLVTTTEIVSRAGEPLVCSDLRAGLQVRVEGLLRPRTQVLVATQIIVAPPPPPAPDTPRRERFRGLVAAVDCARGELAVEQSTAMDAVRRVVRIADATDVRCAGGQPPRCTCADIGAGDGIQVTGSIFPGRPGLVVADSLTVAPAPTVSLTGALTGSNCAAGELTLRDDPGDRLVRIALSRATAIRCGRSPCTCAALNLGDRLQVEGVVVSTQPPTLAALAVTRVGQLPDGSR